MTPVDIECGMNLFLPIGLILEPVYTIKVELTPVAGVQYARSIIGGKALSKCASHYGAIVLF